MVEILRADLHIHPDKWINHKFGKKAHGEDPKAIARAILESRINVAAITPHNAINTDFLEVEAEIERLQTTARFRGHPTPQILLGTEINTIFKRQSYHLVAVFKKPDFTRYNLPGITIDPRKGMPFSRFKDIQKDYECLIFVAHPFKENKDHADANITRSLIRSNVIDAYEAFNGSAFHNILTIQGKLRPKDKRNRKYRRTCYSYTLSRKRPIPKKAALGNSDAHRGNIVGTAYTEYFGEEATAIEDLFEAVTNTKTTPVLGLSTYQAVLNTISKRRNRSKNTSRHPGN